MTRLLPFLFALALLAACRPGDQDTSEHTGTDTTASITKAPEPIVVGDITLIPLTGTGIRTNGWYHSDMGLGKKGLQYYMRFFERGNVALVGGPEQEHGTLGRMLTENVPSGWNQIHNTPVTMRNDSILFRTMSIKGAIDYAGVLYSNGDSIRFLKSSAVTGQRMIVNYGFEPAPLPQ